MKDDKKKKKEIEKPMTLIVRETFDKLIETINNSGVPLILLESMLERILNQVTQLKEQQYMQEKTMYEESLKEVEEKETNEKS